MNWKLIFTLSLVGVVMAFLAVYGLMSNLEPVLWLIIWIAYAIIIAKKAPGSYFFHGLIVSVINGIWIAIIHAAFFDTYIANNPGMMAQYENMPHFASPQVMQLIIGPIIGFITGLIVGLFSYFAARIMNKKARKTVQ